MRLHPLDNSTTHIDAQSTILTLLCKAVPHLLQRKRHRFLLSSAVYRDWNLAKPSPKLCREDFALRVAHEYELEVTLLDNVLGQSHRDHCRRPCESRKHNERLIWLPPNELVSRTIYTHMPWTGLAFIAYL